MVSSGTVATSAQSRHRVQHQQTRRSKLLHAITDFSGSRRGKWIVVILWILATGLVSGLGPRLADHTTNDPLLFLPDGKESKRAAELVGQRFSNETTPAIVVIRNPEGLSDSDFAAGQQIYDQVNSRLIGAGSDVQSLISIYNVPEARGELVSPDNTTMMLLVNIGGSVNEEPYREQIKQLREITQPFDTAALSVKVSGPGGLVSDLVSVFASLDVFLLLVTVGLVLVLLLLIYRSPTIAIIPLLIVGAVFSLMGGLAAWVLGWLGFPISAQSTGITTVILFGAGTDYYLFIASRFREELRKHEDKHVAIQATMRGTGEAILSAGGTLVMAALLLLLADLGSYRGLGPVVAIAIATMMFAALTLIPATLAIVGRAGFWPFQPRFEPDAVEQTESRFWRKIAHTVLERPGRILTTTVLVLLVLVAGIYYYKPSYDTLESLPGNVESVQGFEALRAGFPAGRLAPSYVYVELPEGTHVLDPAGLAQIDAISAQLEAAEGVVEVASAADPFGRGRGPDVAAMTGAIEAIPPQMRAALAETSASGPPDGAGSDPALGQAIGLYMSALRFASDDQGLARIEVTLAENPYGIAAMDHIENLRQTARAAAAEQGIPAENVVVGGETAENADTRSANVRDMLLVLPILLLSIMVALGLLLRSVVAALYLGVTIAFTYFATLGLSILVFKFVFGQESVAQSVPFLLFVFLNALGVDYSIYLMARLREEARHLPLRFAMERALVRTGGVITSAGIILAGTFAALMSLPLRDLFQFGFAVSIGVLIDTFVTRSLLVPSIVELLGDRNWWPSKSPLETNPATDGAASADD